YSARYKVYGRAITGLEGDPVTTTFTQNVRFYDPDKALIEVEADRYTKTVWNPVGAEGESLPWLVEPRRGDEVYLGEVEYTDFDRMMFLVMASGQGPIVLEYLRFVPILP